MIQKKYKVGDKVQLRDDLTYPDYIKKRLKKTNYMVIIDEDIITIDDEYCFEEIPGVWKEDAIVNQPCMPTQIHSRFEILDL